MTPAPSWLLLTLALVGALMTVTALVRGDRLGWGNVFWFLSSWLTTELALFHVLLSALLLAGFAAVSSALEHAPGRVAAALMLLSWLGLIVAQLRTRPTRRVLDDALADGLGRRYRDDIPASRLALLPDTATFREVAWPFALRSTGVEWLRNIPYGDEHPRQKLDIYRPAGGCADAPVLLQIHGGGWVLGDKREQALPLIYFLVARGWVVVAANYRLSPKARFPTHLLDCKRALAWTRNRIAEHGGDPSFIAVTGGSAGGHLAALVGLTANDPRLQPGFEQVDTGVAACVPFYGVYDFLDRHRLKGGGEKVVEWLAKTVMPAPPDEDPALWDLASPIALVRRDAPPFFLLHGTHDSLASVEEARLFAHRLRAVSQAPVVYAELPGAQHAWEIFKSVRAVHSVHAVARFLEWCRRGVRY
jgi:acetyl esterase/lipase